MNEQMEEPPRPTAVHYALVFFIMLSIVNGMGWLLAYKGKDSIPELRQQVSALRRQLDAANQAAAKKVGESTSKEETN